MGLIILGAIMYYFSDYFAILGAIIVIRTLITAAYNAYPFWTSPVALSKYGGPGTWAIITGATDGIGLAFANEFAANKFNIVLVSRTLTKLQAVSDDLTKKYGVATKIIVADFSKSNENPEEFFDNIFAELKGLKVGVLVNNVGDAATKKFADHTAEDLKRVNSLNLWPIVYMTKHALPGMLENDHHGAIINLSSVAGMRPMYASPLYTPGKAFDDFFSRVISLEHGGKIDCISLRPAFVSTNLTRNKKVGGICISPQDCVKGCLQALGKTHYTCGALPHRIVGFVGEMMPDFLAKKYFGPSARKPRS